MKTEEIKPSNPTAFPTTNPLDGCGDPNKGMSLRDYFAGQAIIGIYSANKERAEIDKPEYWAETAYDIADAMLKFREKQST